MAWIQSRAKDIVSNADFKEFDCEFESDVADLPGLDECCMGSEALVWETASLYKLGADNTWKPVGG